MRSRVIAYYEHIMRCSYHARLPGRMHTKKQLGQVIIFNTIMTFCESSACSVFASQACLYTSRLREVHARAIS